MYEGPLTATWDRVSSKLRRSGKVNEVTLAMLHLMFFYGARCAIKAASAGPVSTVLMSAEIRDFERRYVKGAERARQAAVPQGAAEPDRHGVRAPAENTAAQFPPGDERHQA